MKVIGAFAPDSKKGASVPALDRPVIDVNKPLQFFHVFGVYWAKPEREAAVPAHK